MITIEMCGLDKRGPTLAFFDQTGGFSFHTRFSLSDFVKGRVLLSDKLFDDGYSLCIAVREPEINQLGCRGKVTELTGHLRGHEAIIGIGLIEQCAKLKESFAQITR